MPTEPAAPSGLRRVLRLRDLVLFYVTAVVGMRWVAVAAAAGPSSLVVWLIGMLALFLPLAFTVLELSSRYPQEGGIWVWSRQAFGEGTAFVTGWTYWGANLVYLPGLLYFAASTALFIVGPRYAHLQSNGIYFIVVSLSGLTLAVVLNFVGLQFARWLNNVAAISVWAVMGTLVLLAAFAGQRFGSATSIDAASLVPAFGLKQLIFAATLAFALSGFEGGSFLGDEIQNPRRTIPRAVLIAGVTIVAMYVLGTLAILVALPHSQISGLSGIMDAFTAVAGRVGLAGVAPLAAALIVVSALGGVSVWLAANARLPFVAGIDRFLPPAFGRVHPRYGTPHVALITQALVATLCAVLGQAGATPRQAYEILVSLGIISMFLPYLVMFAAMIRLQREPAGSDVIRAPGGASAARLYGALGFLTSLVAIVLSSVPPEGEPHPVRYVVKVVGLSLLLVASGALTYLLGRWRRARAA